MGRRPKPSKNKEAVLSLPAADAFSSERGEQQAFSGESQLENPHPMSSPQKTHLNLPVAGVETSRGSKNQKKHAFKNVDKHRSASTRCSERIKSGVGKVKSTNLKQDVDCVVDMTVSDCEKDDSDAQTEPVQVLPHENENTQTEQVQLLAQENTQNEQEFPQQHTQIQKALTEPNAEMEQLLPEPESELEFYPAENVSEKSVDVKVDYALQKIDALYKIIESLNSKVNENVGLNESPSMALSYRSMYIDSQKKLEDLSNENQQLKGQLENAQGKVEVYEKENGVLSEVLDKMKETVNQQLSNVAKTTEAAVIYWNQEIDNAYSASASKRKRIES